MTDQEKAYIREIVRETIQELPCNKNDDRIGKIEQKVFNGFGTQISLQWAIIAGIFLTVITRWILAAI